MNSNQKVLKVLHINNIDLLGRRFNGYDLIEDIESRGFLSKQIVLNKLSEHPAVIPLIDTILKNEAENAIMQIDERQSFDNLISPWSKAIKSNKAFKEADVVHYHLFHNNMIAIDDFAAMTQLKPSVWTCHDPWPFTGHCIYPLDCKGYKNSCTACPHLGRPRALKRDTSRFHYEKKKRMVAEMKAKVVFASQYMQDFCTSTPIGTSLIDTRVINFGIDPNQALPHSMQKKSRRKYGIPTDDFVIFFRRDKSPYKGLSYIYEALRQWKDHGSVTLLSVGDTPTPTEIKDCFNVIELEWISDTQKMFELYNASDIFLMPSTAEAFGLMALEAMVSELPVICFEGTSLPEIIGEPEHGIAVKSRDSDELLQAIKELKRVPAYRLDRGRKSRAFAIEKYCYRQYLDSLACLYREVYSEFDNSRS